MTIRPFLEVGSIDRMLLLDLFAANNNERSFVHDGRFPEKRPVRVDNDAVGALGLFGKLFATEDLGATGLKFALIGKLKLGGDASAQERVGIEFAQRGVIFVDTAQLGGHAAVDAAVDRGHHVADNIRLLHFFSPIGSLKAEGSLRANRSKISQNLRRCLPDLRKKVSGGLLLSKRLVCSNPTLHNHVPFTQNRQIFHPHSPGHLVALPPVGFLRQGSPALNGTFDSNSAVCFGSSLLSE